MLCSKCGAKNDDDAKYCEECGQSLQKSIQKPNYAKEKTNNGMSTIVKALIVVCVVLIVGIGITAGMLLQKPSQVVITPQTNNNGVSTQESTTSQLYQATWHQIATYTGPGEVDSTFSIKGSKFKVTMSAVPMITYNNNYLDVGIGSGSYLVGTNTLSWGTDEKPTKKEALIPVSQGAGTYDIQIVPTDIQSYTVTVWDYY